MRVQAFVLSRDYASARASGERFKQRYPNADVVRKINKSTGMITTVACEHNGFYREFFGDDGPATTVRFWAPPLRDIALDSAGNLYLGDYDSSGIRAVRGPIS